MKNLETGLTYARLNHVYGGSKREPSWFAAFIYCLKHNDEESAELIRQLNTPRSDECDDHEHDSCNFKWCGCRCHSFEVPALVGAPLRSCAEVWDEQKELETV